jgi:hypothetical protein
MTDHPFYTGMDLEIATIRRRNLLTVISGLSSEGCKVKDPEAAIAEFSALVAECDEEIERLKASLEVSHE